MTRSIYRYIIRVDGEEHTVRMNSGEILTVAIAEAEDVDFVEFWAVHDVNQPEVNRVFTVVGTGHPIPFFGEWRGTCPRTSLGLVWHLVELTEVES